MEIRKGKSKVSHTENDPEQGKSSQPEGIGGDDTELLSQFAREGIDLLKKDADRLREREDLTPGIEKGLRGVVEKYLSEWRKMRGEPIE